MNLRSPAAGGIYAALEVQYSNIMYCCRFNELLDSTRNRHQTVVETMAEGVMEMKERLSPQDYVSVDTRIQYFLDRFYLSRIGLRMLIHQHCELSFHVAFNTV